MSKVTYDEVEAAFKALTDEGLHPSIDRIRKALGDRGSRTTIQKHLSALRLKTQGLESASAVSQAITALIAPLAEGLIHQAKAVVEAGLKESTEALSHTEESNRLIRDECDQLKRSLAQAHEQGERLQSDLEQVRADYADRCRENVEVTLKQDGLAAALAQEQARAEALISQLQHQAQSIEHFHDASKDQRAQLERSLNAQIEQVQHALMLAKQEQQVYQEQASEASKKCSLLQQELLEMKKQQQRDAETHATRQETINQLSEQSIQARIDLEIAASKASQARIDGDNQRQENKALLSANAVLTSEKAALMARLNTLIKETKK